MRSLRACYSETACQEFGTEARERVRLRVDSMTNGHTERLLISRPPKDQESLRAISAVRDVWWTHGVLADQRVCLKLFRIAGCASAPIWQAPSHVTNEAILGSR